MHSSEKTWHSLSLDTILEHFQVEIDSGLNHSEVESRQAKYGPNQLKTRSGKSRLSLLLSQFNQPLVYILLISAVITAGLQEWVDSGVIFTVVLINAVIGYSQEANAVKAIEALNRNLISKTTVWREAKKRQINQTELVPGDLVFLQSGDKVPADLRLIEIHSLRIDESILTGESLPVEKQLNPLPINTLLADRTNMAFASSLVSYGTALGIVVNIGDQTQIGLINRLIASVNDLDTPLTHKISQFAHWLLWIIIGFALLTFSVGVWRGESLLDMFMAAVALAVGAIPEGLPAAMTITLAIGVSRMAKRNAIIRKLPAVETLGSTTVICSDKTGTLTQNQMTVQAIFAGNQLFSVSGSGYQANGSFKLDQQTTAAQHHPALLECLCAGVLCNDARLIKPPDHWHIEGDPTEAALLVAATKANLNISQLNSQQPRLDAIPFESQHQFMATLHRKQTGDGYCVYLKGAAESLIKQCDYALNDQGQTIAFDQTKIYPQINELARQGLRVLVFARSDYPNGNALSKDHLHQLVFLGLQAMIDPPRPEAASSIAACYSAGIKVKMITGDHPITALAIAKQLGMREAEQVVSGFDLDNANPDEFCYLANQHTVFARIAPEQKLRLVQALQAKGQIVAMTGDGVNDAPALRQANIGVAMGLSGTDVAKEAAAMVLTDDEFATITHAIEEGRGVFDNIVKFIAWTLPTNLGEGLVITAAVLANVALPITPLQILWINMTTAVLLGLMLSFEPKEPDLMTRQPRNPQQAILTRHLGFRIILVGLLLLTGAFGLFEWELAHGETLAAARTVAVNVFVFGQIMYLFNCRSLKYSMFHVGISSNPWLILGVAIMTGLQLVLTYWQPMQMVFGTTAIASQEWLLIGMVSWAIYFIVGLEKLILRQF